MVQNAKEVILDITMYAVCMLEHFSWLKSFPKCIKAAKRLFIGSAEKSKIM
jgi:hypothetical protein